MKVTTKKLHIKLWEALFEGRTIQLTAGPGNRYIGPHILHTIGNINMLLLDEIYEAKRK